MSETNPATGSCLCGAVNFTVKSISDKVGACHCNMCQKWGGGPLLAVDAGTDVTYDGADNISVYDSSEWAERGFCAKCGSHLFYRFKGTQQHMVPAGSLDNTGSLIFDHQVFIDEKPAFYCFSNATEDMTGAEVFAKYAPEYE